MVAAKNILKSFARDEQGASAIEYALIAGGIFVAIIAIVGEVGIELQTPFTNVKNGLQ